MITNPRINLSQCFRCLASPLFKGAICISELVTLKVNKLEKISFLMDLVCRNEVLLREFVCLTVHAISARDQGLYLLIY